MSLQKDVYNQGLSKKVLRKSVYCPKKLFLYFLISTKICANLCFQHIFLFILFTIWIRWYRCSSFSFMMRSFQTTWKFHTWIEFPINCPMWSFALFIANPCIEQFKTLYDMQKWLAENLSTNQTSWSKSWELARDWWHPPLSNWHHAPCSLHCFTSLKLSIGAELVSWGSSSFPSSSLVTTSTESIVL